MDAWQRYLELATGVTGVTRKGAESVVRTLVKQGEVAADRAERAVDDLLSRSEANRKLVAALVRTETERAVARLGVAQQADLDRLREQVAEMGARLDALGSAAPATPPSRPAKRSAASRRAGAVRGTSTARRAQAAGADTSAPAAAPAKRATSKKTTAKKTTAKKTTAKKTTAKRSAAQRRATETAAAAHADETHVPTSPEADS